MTEIDNVDIGNEHSAFIEVLVARSTDDPPIYHALIPAASFMSPADSRNSKNPSSVRMFKRAQLSQSALNAKWDRVKVVCTQPFNKQCAYGLSFIRLAAPDTSDANGTLNFGAFKLKADTNTTSPGLGAGSMFANRKHAVNTPNTSTTTSPAAPASLPPSLTSTPKTTTVPSKRSSTDSNTPPPSTKRHKQATGKGTKPADGIDIKGGTQTPSTSKTQQKQKPKKVPFNKLLNGVTFVLSGYQNPQRGELRQKAIDMGAVYKPEWSDDTCTHLVCAFANTPKHKQVKGKAIVVNDKWITNCYTQRKRLHWRQYSLDSADRNKADSDTELIANSSGGEDTDEEVQKIIHSKTNGNGGDSNNDNTPTVSMSNECGKDLDVDEDGLPVLPTFFDNMVFMCHKSLPAQTTREVKRFVVAFGGQMQMYMGPTVTHIVVDTKWNNDFDTAMNTNQNVTFVKSEWVLKCAKLTKYIPIEEYLVKKDR